MTDSLVNPFGTATFPNDYQLVNGVELQAVNPETFHIPPNVIKRHIRPNHFIELRIDSPRFSVHEETPIKCSCPSCHGEMTKPILRHEHPSSLVPLPPQNTPSRGWGEDFWVRVTDRTGPWFRGIVDNPLVESRLHGLKCGDFVVFHEDHILAVHQVHRHDLIVHMKTEDLRELALWLAEQRRSEPR